MAGSAVNLTGMLGRISGALGSPAQLSEGQRGLFQTMGASLAPMPQVDQEDPASLRAAAAEAMRRGDAQTAQTYATMAQQVERSQFVKREEERYQNRYDAGLLDEANAEVQSSLAQKQAMVAAKKQEAAKQAQVDKIANAALPRIGADNAELLKALPYEQMGPALKEMLKTKNRKTSVIQRVDDNGDTHNIMIDEDGNDIRDLGVEKKGLSAKDAAKADENKAKAEKKLRGYEASAKNVQARVAEAMKLAKDGTFTTGVGGQLTGWIGGSDAKDLNAKLTTIKANLGFDRLQEMRDASPTGGALGQVAIQELVALQSAVDSLDQAQSKEQLVAALEVVNKHYDRWLSTMRGDLPEDSSQTEQPKIIDYNDL